MKGWSHSLRAGPQGIEYLMEGVKSGYGGGVQCLCRSRVTSYPIIHFLKGDNENKRIGRSAADLVFRCLL